jgi:hypothetical protein
MTTNELERGKEIQSEITSLKEALIALNKRDLFSISEQSCSRYGSADPFLSGLHLDVKASATTQILAEILRLETEFDSL